MCLIVLSVLRGGGGGSRHFCLLLRSLSTSRLKNTQKWAPQHTDMQVSSVRSTPREPVVEVRTKKGKRRGERCRWMREGEEKGGRGGGDNGMMMKMPVKGMGWKEEWEGGKMRGGQSIKWDKGRRNEWSSCVTKDLL